MNGIRFRAGSWVATLLWLCAAGGTAAAATRAEPPRPLALHATRGDDPGIFDSRGREVLLRGVNVNQLGDYYQANPAWPQVVTLRRSDFRRIARIGFNSVRLLVSWSRLEPSPGEFNRDYVARVRRAVRWARGYGLHVILDMHQDAWGKFIATEPGESCPPGSNPSVGWDGAPEWATITDGLSTCNYGLRELSPAVGQAWESFYLDREGIRTKLVQTWGRLARSFASNRAVAGYDLLNEPNPGLTPGNDTAVLGEFYGDAIEAIRAAEASKRRGFEHIVFFEPGVVWSAAATYPTPPPSFTADENIVFAPHIYAESISPVSIEQGFDFARRTAASYGVTVWSGEWGYFSEEPADDADKIARYAREEDAAQYGGAWWDWKQACGDPHVIHSPGGEPDALSPSLNRYVCENGPPGRSIGVPKIYREVLSRPVVRAAPAQLVSMRSDPAAGSLELEGRSPRPGCGLRVFVPSQAARPRAEGENVSRLRAERVLGDWIVSACVGRGSYSLEIG